MSDSGGQLYIFDTTEARAVIQLMNQRREEMLNQLAALDSNVSALVGTEWIAPGANIFKQEYDDWSLKIRTSILKLDEYSQSLMNEINEWEAHGAAANIPQN